MNDILKCDNYYIGISRFLASEIVTLYKDKEQTALFKDPVRTAL